MSLVDVLGPQLVTWKLPILPLHYWLNYWGQEASTCPCSGKVDSTIHLLHSSILSNLQDSSSLENANLTYRTQGDNTEKEFLSPRTNGKRIKSNSEQIRSRLPQDGCRLLPVLLRISVLFPAQNKAMSLCSSEFALISRSSGHGSSLWLLQSFYSIRKGKWELYHWSSHRLSYSS